MSDAGRQRDTLRRLFEAAVAAAHPSACVVPHLPAPPARGRLIVLAAGKAGASMAAAAERFYRERHGLSAGRLTGLAVTRHGYGEPAGLIPVVEAGHPMPDRQGVEATERTLALAGEATADDLVLVLLSGGGSANWIAPAGQLTLEEKQGITRALLRSGATIGEINTVRKHLSRIKGGRLAAVAAPAPVLTLAISDVPFDDPAVIASGPTVPDPSTLAEARAIVARRKVPLPASAAALLDSPASETPKPGNPVFSATEFRIVARPADAVAAAAQSAIAAGYEPLVLGADLEGEAREVAAAHAEMAKDARASGRRVAIVSGGELTVTIERPGPRRAEPGICAGARRRARRPPGYRGARRRHRRHRRRRRLRRRPRRRDHRRHHARARAGARARPGGVSRRERFDRFLRASLRPRHLRTDPNQRQ